MTSKTYRYQFSDQKVFASDSAPLSFQIKGDYAFVAMNNYTVAVYDISISNITAINVFPVCGCVIKIDYCVSDDYIITLESKDHSDANTNLNNSIRTYHNWRNGEVQNKIRFRAALGTRLSNSSSNIGNNDRSSGSCEFSYLENVIEVLEFLHLVHPTGFSVYASESYGFSNSSKIPSQSYENTNSNIAISESTYVHLYQFCPSNRRSSLSGLSPKQSRMKSKEIDPSFNDNNSCFQHLFTVNFSFVVTYIDFLSQVLAAASSDKVQAIQILEEKQKIDMFSCKLEKENMNTVKQIEIDIEKSWLSSINNERKTAASKPGLKPKEIIGPTQNLDTASITLLRYADSKEISFQTLLFRKYVSPSNLQNIHLEKVPDFNKLGLFIVLKHEIILYSFCMETNEVEKIAEYDFQNESVISMAFSNNVNLIHVAFSNGDLITYNSRLCSTELFESNIISKRISLTRLGKVGLMGLTDVKSNGLLICACCKFNLTEVNETENAIIISPDSWNFYLFTQPLKEDLKKSIIAHAAYKGSKKFLQMLLCSLLVFPSKEEISFETLKEIVIYCLKCDSFYSELAPSLLLRENMRIVEALMIFQVLETKELYDDSLFQLYAKKKLINANFADLSEEHFRWIVIKILNCSINLLFDVIVTNDLEDFLKADLMTIEGIVPVTFESVIIKILYYAAHTDYDLVAPLLAQLDQKEIKKLLKTQPHLIYNKKHHTQFGWVLNLYNPHIYAEVVASLLLNETKNCHEFTYLEAAKQVGLCSHMLVLEEIFHIALKKHGLIPNSSKYCKSKFQNENLGDFNMTREIFQDPKKNQVNNDSYKNHINQLLLIYHEFSFNAVEFCPHKPNQICKKIPSWLKSFRYHNILNQFYPFNGTDPFTGPHNPTATCSSMCCQSYLLRLQCLMSWKNSFNLPGRNVIEASCESKNHPAWKSLNFLLLQHIPIEHRNISDIIDFLTTSERSKDNNNLVDIYFTSCVTEISLTAWKKTFENPSNRIIMKNLLKYAITMLKLDEFIEIISSLKESKIIEAEDYNEWVERSGRYYHRQTLFTTILKQTIDELT